MEWQLKDVGSSKELACIIMRGDSSIALEIAICLNLRTSLLPLLLQVSSDRAQPHRTERLRAKQSVSSFPPSSAHLHPSTSTSHQSLPFPEFPRIIFLREKRKEGLRDAPGKCSCSDPSWNHPRPRRQPCAHLQSAQNRKSMHLHCLGPSGSMDSIAATFQPIQFFLTRR